jgi:hypothetical protein
VGEATELGTAALQERELQPCPPALAASATAAEGLLPAPLCWLRPPGLNSTAPAPALRSAPMYCLTADSNMESHLFRLLSVPVLAPQSLGGGGLSGRSSTAAAAAADLQAGQQVPPEPSLVVFSGGTAFNSVAGHMRQLTTRIAHVLPVSDDGGSTAEIVRVVGGPAVGDIRSRCLRLAGGCHATMLLPGCRSCRRAGSKASAHLPHPPTPHSSPNPLLLLPQMTVMRRRERCGACWRTA